MRAKIGTSQRADRALSAVDSDDLGQPQLRGRDPGRSITSPPSSDIP